LSKIKTYFTLRNNHVFGISFFIRQNSGGTWYHLSLEFGSIWQVFGMNLAKLDDTGGFASVVVCL
jgi:hypothetical protein